MIGLLRAPARQPDTAPVLPLHAAGRPVYAVGDVHGCLPLYHRIEAAILADAARLGAAPVIILLGDMVDRGPQTAGLLDLLTGPPRGELRRLCLMGNHEAMMLDFLAAPRADAAWLDCGGAATLASYGLTLAGDEPARRLRQRLAACIPAAHRRFLSGLPLALRHGDWVLAHAGFDAARPLDAQPRAALLWGRSNTPPPAGLTLVHGHFVQPEPHLGPGRIAIDLGAFATGRLAAIRLIPDTEPVVLTVNLRV